jgi:hypothetical protein
MDFEGRRKVSLNPFSPWRNSAENLQRTIVGRDFIIKDLLDKVRRFSKGAPAKHCLLIGKRGLGKTHALSLLYHYLAKNCLIPEFKTIANGVLPVIILEEERYSLNSLALFLIKIFEKLSEKDLASDKCIIPEQLDSDEDVIEYCFENLKSVSASIKKKIIILCDNLEEVLKQWQEREYKMLRAFLSDQQAIMIIGTTVKIFKEIISPKQPFYEFFEMVPLYDLTVEQMLELWKKRFIEDHLEEEFKQKEKLLKNKVIAMAKLTGGNPRMMVFLYDAATKKNVFEIENAIEELMENLNEYFRNCLTSLAPQERTILDAFADMEGPATPLEIARRTRIKEQSTYAHIKRLKDAGFIEVVEFGKHKISRYDVTERLFRLWRQTATASGRKKFQILIRSLKLYFIPEEITSDFNYKINNGFDFLPRETLYKEKDEGFYKFNSPVQMVKDEPLKNAMLYHLINRACEGEFGEQMEGLPGKIRKENLDGSQILEFVNNIFYRMENFLKDGDTHIPNGFFLTLLKLNEWHKIDRVQEILALYLRKLVAVQDQILFINSIKEAEKHIVEKDLLELIKAFLYAGRYLEKRNKVILEEVFPETRDIIFDIIEKFDS